MKWIQAGNASPIASSSAELLSVMKNFAFHDGFQAVMFQGLCESYLLFQIVANYSSYNDR